MRNDTTIGAAIMRIEGPDSAAAGAVPPEAGREEELSVPEACAIVGAA
ncbi:MAG TPA: hypothetical protein VGQ67_08375 [Candidatus Polarisedimenticolia bacterium]|nr:hypothetical protein [Candidatus Polarisedimenticolia bacterium]